MSCGGPHVPRPRLALGALGPDLGNGDQQLGEEGEAEDDPSCQQPACGWIKHPFGDSIIVLLWRGPSIFHPHLALADYFSLGSEPEVLQVAFIFLGPGHSSSGSRSHLVGRLSVGQCNASVPFIHSAFACCLHGCLLVSPRQRYLVLHCLPKMECGS